ncbi:uncharacterized protein LOC117290967 isoform X2 [Asterias rubens]|uniref:uncharacterized protein LOC117290967 isoform X2 n=1 Tax=Asterias rubens TaxID=7604 RepID=UPI0014557D1F|nr:uncharacterized protein LOC117290967 isoform X2 [Asterias rubens]
MADKKAEVASRSERFHYNGFLPDTLNSSYHEVDLNAEPPPSDADVVIIDGQQSRTLKDKELLQQAQREEDDSDEELDFYEVATQRKRTPSLTALRDGQQGHDELEEISSDEAHDSQQGRLLERPGPYFTKI